jgi:hypothetical protein
MKKKILEELLGQFNKSYSYLYTYYVTNGEEHPFYKVLLTSGDELICHYSEIVKDFEEYRGSLIVSDREVAALALAVNRVDLRSIK